VIAPSVRRRIRCYVLAALDLIGLLGLVPPEKGRR
jgi:hypothetical protein